MFKVGEKVAIITQETKDKIVYVGTGEIIKDEIPFKSRSLLGQVMEELGCSVPTAILRIYGGTEKIYGCDYKFIKIETFEELSKKKKLVLV